MKRYLKNSKECILCSTRKKLIQITPEEIVRQEFVLKLITDYEVPADLIDVEVYIGKQGRADIIVFEYDSEKDVRIPLIVIECKAPNIHLTDKVFEQVSKYHYNLQPEIMIMTNGIDTMIYTWNDKENEYFELKEIPKYSDLINRYEMEYVDEFKYTWERPNHQKNIEENRTQLINDGNIGEDTDIKLVSFITNLVGLLYDEQRKTVNLNLKNKLLIMDGGLRLTTFGNAAGGSFTGLYRYFIVENEKQDTEIVSVSVMGKLSAKNHPKWGNMNGFTLLNVAIDDFENSHMSLEYSIDRFVKIENDKYSFWHDGTMTVGKLGRVKNSEVIKFVKENCPHLINEDKIYLGTLDNKKVLTWEDEDVNNLIANFIDYAFVRDKFRKFFKHSKSF